MSVEVVAEIILAEGSEEANLAAIRTLVEETHANDPGCLLYALHRDTADPNRLVMVEKWESAEALDAHNGRDHIREFGEKADLAAAPRVLVLESLGFGEAEKGSL